MSDQIYMLLFEFSYGEHWSISLDNLVKDFTGDLRYLLDLEKIRLNFQILLIPLPVGTALFTRTIVQAFRLQPNF